MSKYLFHLYSLFVKEKGHVRRPTDLSVSLVHHGLLFQSAGVWSSRSFWVSCPSHRGLETHEIVQPSTGPADPGGDAAASNQWLTPLPPLRIASSSGPSAGLSAPPGPSASSSQARPKVTQKAPRSRAGRAQLAAASQKWGHGEGSKGIRLEDSSASGRAKRTKWSNQPDSTNICRPQYEDTFEDSDDSNESFDGPFSGSSLSAMASSTSGNPSQTSK